MNDIFFSAKRGEKEKRTEKRSYGHKIRNQARLMGSVVIVYFSIPLLLKKVNIISRSPWRKKAIVQKYIVWAMGSRRGGGGRYAATYCRTGIFRKRVFFKIFGIFVKIPKITIFLIFSKKLSTLWFLHGTTVHARTTRK